MEKPIDEDEVRQVLQEILRAGITSIAVVFIHSYTFPAHEQTVRRIAESMYVCMYVYYGPRHLYLVQAFVLLHLT